MISLRDCFREMHEMHLTGSTEIIGLPCYLDVGFGLHLVFSLAAIPGCTEGVDHAYLCTKLDTANRRERPRKVGEPCAGVISAVNTCGK